MRILITNDDGINAPGLAAAEDIAAQVAGPDGEVWVVAPALEQSAVSHAVAYVRPMRLEQLGPRRFAIEGSPADCVMAAIDDIMADAPPDLVLSGVNKGFNVAEDIIYSGTVAGAMEGALRGVRSIAMSQYFGPGNADLPDMFDAARAQGARVVAALAARATWETGTYGVFYNVNFPPIPAGQVQGVKATVQGQRNYSNFVVEPQTAPNRRRYYWLKHPAKGGNAVCARGTDAREAHEGFVTVTPLRADLTARDLVSPLAGALGDL